jgi:hypothetical protein
LKASLETLKSQNEDLHRTNLKDTDKLAILQVENKKMRKTVKALESRAGIAENEFLRAEGLNGKVNELRYTKT